MSWNNAVWPTLILLLAGFVKGVIGLGLPAVGVGLLGLLMQPSQAAAMLVAPSTVTNVWQLAAGPKFGALVLRLWPLLVGILLGGWLGAGSLVGPNAAHARFWLGVVLAVYAAFGLVALQPTIPQRWEVWLGLLVGVLTGLATAGTGVFTIPAVPYLNGLGLKREDLIQAMGLSFTISTLGLAVDLAHSGAFNGRVMLASMSALLPALAGMLIGTYARHRISPAVFRTCFFAGMLVLGAQLIRQ